MDQAPAGTEHMRYGDPNRFPESVSVLWRNVFQTLLAGQGFWFYDHRLVSRLNQSGKNKDIDTIYYKTGWWENPFFMKEIAQIRAVANSYCSGAPGEKATAADVLLVYDTGSEFGHRIFDQREVPIHDAVGRTGAVYDCINAMDLALADLTRYKCIIMINTFMITPERRSVYREFLKNKTVIWLYAAGYSDGQTLSVGNIGAVLEIPVRKVVRQTTMTAGDETIDLSDAPYDPYFAAVPSAGITPLAHYADGSIAAAKRGSTVWFGTMHITADMLLSVFHSAGVHIWAGHRVPVMAGCGLVLINRPSGGDTTITLPDGREIQETLPPWTTAVYDMKTLERVL